MSTMISAHHGPYFPPRVSRRGSAGWAVAQLLALALVACRPPPASEPTAAEGEPTDAEIEAICQQRACREETPLWVQVSRTQAYQGVYLKSPYVAAPGVLVVLPGEKIQVKASVAEDGTLGDLEVVPEGGDFEVSVIQWPGDVTPTQTMLVVQSHFERHLAYCAYINIPGKGRRKTSIIGVRPKISASEHWLDPITEIVMTDLRLTDTPTECR